MTAAPADSLAASDEWFQLSAQVDSTQKVVGGEWERRGERTAGTLSAWGEDPVTRTPRLLFATVIATAVVALTVGCSQGKNEDGKMSATPIGNSAAKAQWFDLTARIEATQQLVGGDWEVVDSNARPCNEGAVNWSITRIGPGVRTAEREELLDNVEMAWKKNGWEPVRRATGGDAPGLQLRYPASGVLGGGFYVELESTVHGTTIGAQTACAAGDVDQLNREQFAFNNTPGYRPTPAASPTALTPHTP